ncbi:hypothetical protein LIER_37751 [Lithospermum erythrorhizon]|uniref:Retrovirus-related Pol polyprotein from transposon TNT 1-94-like beta-barrel domain-containing protein n=1 Tax=Lithospermum erythrorhizon TaxID=34254 RepID=A0AAV3PRI6_LITER
MSRNCRNNKGNNNAQDNASESIIIAMILDPEFYMAGGSDGWWIDSGASRHCCFDRSLFKSYNEIKGYCDADWNTFSDDSKATSGYLFNIAEVQSHYYNGKTRQIRRKHNTVREFLTTGAVRVDHIRSKENMTDTLA